MKQRLILMISGIAFLVLCLSPGISGIVVFITLCLLLCVGISVLPMQGNVEHLNRYQLVCGLLFNVLVAAFFCFAMSDFSKLDAVASILGVSKNVLLVICSCIAAIIAVPFTATIFRKLPSSINSEHDLKNENHNQLLSGKIFWLCSGVSAIIVLLLLVFSFSPDIWADEAFTLALIEHSYFGVIRLTAADVHPPVYYVIVKTLVDGVHIFLPEISSVYLAKLSSVVAYIILLIVCMTKVRKDWGDYVAGTLAVCLVGMSNLAGYWIEIRMYGWGLLFVTLAFLCANDVVKRKTRAAWVLFVVFSLCAAYTHYFACVAAGVSYLILLVWSLKNDRTMLKKWAIASAATVIFYLPWLYVLFRQMQLVSTSYWISDITISDVMGYVVFAFGYIPFAVLCVYLIVQQWRNQKTAILNNWPSVFACGGILIPICTACTGIIVSLLIRPVFISRYLVPGLGCLWLGILILCDRLNIKLLKQFTVCFIMVVTVINLCGFFYVEGENWTKSQEAVTFLKNNEDVVYICDTRDDGSTVYLSLAAMSGKPCYLWNWEIDGLSSRVYKNLGTLYTTDEIEMFLSEGKKVYFVADRGGITIDEVLYGSNLTYIDSGEHRVEATAHFYQILEGSELS